MTEPRHASPQPLSWLTPQIRAWMYGIITALVPILTITELSTRAQRPSGSRSLPLSWLPQPP